MLAIIYYIHTQVKNKNKQKGNIFPPLIKGGQEANHVINLYNKRRYACIYTVNHKKGHPFYFENNLAKC